MTDPTPATITGHVSQDQGILDLGVPVAKPATGVVITFTPVALDSSALTLATPVRGVVDYLGALTAPEGGPLLLWPGTWSASAYGIPGVPFEFTVTAGQVADLAGLRGYIPGPGVTMTVVNITSVSATTLPAGSPASATFAGGGLDFGIPQGPAGPAGATGPQGLPGADGAAGPQGIQGPQGLTGATGLTGPAGADGLPGAQGIQGPAGADGAAGLQGPQGLTGATGPAGPTAVSTDAGNTARLGLDGLLFVPAGSSARLVKHSFAAPYDYVGNAPAGSLDTDAVWVVTRIDTSASPIVTSKLTGIAWSNRGTAGF